jgi:S1-C subfamily serine protease
MTSPVTDETVRATVARDAASGLALLRVPPANVPALAQWTPLRLQAPRFLVAADMTADGVSLRPVFVGAMTSVTAPGWRSPLWGLPQTVLRTGTFVFTIDGLLAGVTVDAGGQAAIVPAQTLFAAASRLEQQDVPDTLTGDVGLRVAPVTPQIAAATHATSGVVVTWVDPQGPGANVVAVGDVIEALNDTPTPSPAYWDAQIAPLLAGDQVRLTIRRKNEVVGVPLVARPLTDAVRERPLGLVMRSVRGSGVEVVRVEPNSAAARAGLQVGDLVTLFGDVQRPTPAQVARTFAEASADRPILLAVTRGDTHTVLTLEKRN